MPQYEYEAINDGGGVWMVKRFPASRTSDDDYTESLLRNMPSDTTEKDAIQLAIERNSWA